MGGEEEGLVTPVIRFEVIVLSRALHASNDAVTRPKSSKYRCLGSNQSLRFQPITSMTIRRLSTNASMASSHNGSATKRRLDMMHSSEQSVYGTLIT